MRVLDIDLDFFLADTCPLAEKGSRPALAGHEPWPAADVRAFLTERCGLSPARPVPGRVFETHDGALFLWQELLAARKPAFFSGGAPLNPATFVRWNSGCRPTFPDSS